MNRFTQLASYVPTPDQFFQPQEYLPDLGLVGGFLESQGALLDESQALRKSVDFIQESDVDRNAANRLMSSHAQQRDDIAAEFARGEFESAQSKLRQFKSQFAKDFTPGGEAYALGENKKLYDSFIASIPKMKDVGGRQQEFLRKESLSRFGGTNFQGSNGSFNTFNGIQGIAEQDVLEYALDKVKGFKADVNIVEQLGENGTVRGYFNEKTQKSVDPKEVAAFAYNAIMSDSAVIASMAREAEMIGLTGDDALQYIDQQAKLAAQNAGIKEGFIEEKNVWKKDFQTEGALNRKNRLDVAAYQYKMGDPADRLITIGGTKSVVGEGGASASEVRTSLKQYNNIIDAQMGTILGTFGDTDENAPFRNSLMDEFVQETGFKGDIAEEASFLKAVRWAAQEGKRYTDDEGHAHEMAEFMPQVNIIEDARRSQALAETRLKQARAKAEKETFNSIIPAETDREGFQKMLSDLQETQGFLGMSLKEINQMLDFKHVPTGPSVPTEEILEKDKLARQARQILDSNFSPGSPQRELFDRYRHKIANGHKGHKGFDAKIDEILSQPIDLAQEGSNLIPSLNEFDTQVPAEDKAIKAELKKKGSITLQNLILQSPFFTQGEVKRDEIVSALKSGDLSFGDISYDVLLGQTLDGSKKPSATIQLIGKDGRNEQVQIELGGNGLSGAPTIEKVLRSDEYQLSSQMQRLRMSGLLPGAEVDMPEYGAKYVVDDSGQGKFMYYDLHGQSHIAPDSKAFDYLIDGRKNGRVSEIIPQADPSQVARVIGLISNMTAVTENKGDIPLGGLKKAFAEAGIKNTTEPQRRKILEIVGNVTPTIKKVK